MTTRSPVRSALRRCAVMAAVVAGVLLTVAPASADHRRHRRVHYYGPHVAAFFPLPPIPLFLPVPPIPVIVVPPRGGYYRPYPAGHGYGGGYYDDGYYDDGYRDYGRHGHHHGDCDD